jgi:hypothetical protein
MDKIYIVLGCSGKYDNHKTWIAKAFWNRSDAVDYARKCQDEADKILKKIEIYEKENTFEAKKDPIKYLKGYNALWKTHKYDDLFEKHYEIPIEYIIKEVHIQ